MPMSSGTTDTTLLPTNPKRPPGRCPDQLFHTVS
jgi:hypothetical protein